MTFFGLQIADYSQALVHDRALIDQIASWAETAERVGFDAVFAVDHVHQVGVNGPPENAMPEAYGILAALAMRTSRVGLGALVTAATYRNPAHLAKIATTLDIVSGGRAILGMGAGWNDLEAAAYGMPFPPLGERFERMRETLEICRRMFDQPRSSFEGRFYRTDGALNYPRPLQPHGPRILIGGSGERKTLRLVAEYADISHILGGTPADVRSKLDVLEGHCADVGRNPAEILKVTQLSLVVRERQADAETALNDVVRFRIEGLRRMNLGFSEDGMRGTMVAGDPEGVVDRLEAFLEAGIDGFTISNFFLPTPERIELAGEVIRLLASRRSAAA